jgi:hypothetical protein
MKKIPRRASDPVRLIWSIILCLLIVAATFAVLRLVRMLPKESLEERFSESIKRQAEWFGKNQRSAGDFVYEQYALTGEEKEGNNIVRQAGALYGLGQAAKFIGNEETVETLEKGLSYFRTLVSTPSANAMAITFEDETQTNTTALLVLALVEYIEGDSATRKTTENLEYLVQLSNYLAGTQTDTGAYINTYLPEPTESDYNNGETMYALIRSYGLTRKETHLQSVRRAADYAMSHYGNQDFNSAFFSWGMAAFAYLYKMEPEEKYWNFMKDSTEKYFAKRGDGYERLLKNTNESTIIPGSAVFLEGITHVGWIARDTDPVLFAKLKRHARSVLEYLLRYEINSPYGRYRSDAPSVASAVCAQISCETTRIDFLQHNMSAMFLYLTFLR